MTFKNKILIVTLLVTFALCGGSLTVFFSDSAAPATLRHAFQGLTAKDFNAAVATLKTQPTHSQSIALFHSSRRYPQDLNQKRELPGPNEPENPRPPHIKGIVIAAPNDGLALVLEHSTGADKWVKIGSTTDGWVLRSIREKSVLWEKNGMQKRAVLRGALDR
ncbi:MAG: hypothetical protein AAF607_03305 [Pseudomonadota bacterium]